MENNINLNSPANDYLKHFRMAWTNLEKLSREETRKRLYRRKRYTRRQR
jgi:hypothetical protein